MKQTVTMPALSDTMNIGRLAKWLKKPGDAVKKGEAIAEVETDKAVMEVEAFYDGYLAGPFAAVDTDLPLGAPIAYIVDNPAEAASGGAAPSAAPIAAETAAFAGRPAPAPSSTAPPGGPVTRASPYARSLAHELGIDLRKIAPGQSAPIGATELLKAAARSAMPELAEGPPYRLERASSLRAAVSRNMIACATTPTFRLTAQLPLEPSQKLAKERNLSLTLLLARASALTVKAHPLFNAAYTPEGIAQREQVDIGIAVDLPEGLITPVLRDVAARPMAALAEDWRILRDKLKSRRLASADYRGATFYLSDLGIFPVVESFDSIIPLGASAILSVAAARQAAAMFTLSCDHRVVFGADGARFLTTLSAWLSEPEKLLG